MEEKGKSSKILEEEENKEYMNNVESQMACEHISFIENYCEQCSIFICEECSISHMDHIEWIHNWKSLIIDIKKSCLDSFNRAHLLLKSAQNIDLLRASVLGKIDAACDEIINRIVDYKKQLKEEIWEEFKENENFDAEVEEQKDLSELLELVER